MHRHYTSYKECLKKLVFLSSYVDVVKTRFSDGQLKAQKTETAGKLVKVLLPGEGKLVFCKQLQDNSAFYLYRLPCEL